jgi:hypothetical protein
MAKLALALDHSASSSSTVRATRIRAIVVGDRGGELVTTDRVLASEVIAVGTPRHDYGLHRRIGPMTEGIT